MSILVLSLLMLTVPAVRVVDTLVDALFRVDVEEGAIVRLGRQGGEHDTGCIREGRRFGDVIARFRTSGET